MHLDRYDALLTELHAFAPLYPQRGRSLANHAPMVLDALFAVGADARAEAWLARSTPYLKKLPRGNVLGLRERMGALGDAERTADWITTFQVELDEQGVERTLRVALPLLAPGALAASFHGVLRTAHALRALSRGESPVRLTELAHGLGSWAAGHQLLPGLERPTSLAEDRLPVAEWLAQIPLLPGADRREGLLHEIVHPLAEHAAWRAHVARLGAVSTSETALHRVAAWSAQRLVLDPQGINGHLHGVTVTSSLAWFVPWVDRDQLGQLTRLVVLALGAVHAASASDGVRECIDGDSLTPEELLEAALVSEDDHALKLVEAVLRIQAAGEVDPCLRRGAELWIRRARARRAA
ncbi:MAG: hypothetical protein R3B89_25380 [Polyangiaceae bacterium]